MIKISKELKIEKAKMDHFKLISQKVQGETSS